MIVRADDLQPEGLRVDVQIEVGPLSYEGGLEIGVAGANLSALVLPARGGLVCAGRIVATAFVPCSRCLEAYALPVDRRFDVTYEAAPPEREPEVMELQISKEDLDVSYLDRQGSLDLRDLVSEQIYLELPMKPLCAPDCKGLCPRCGSNLNSEGCVCAATA